MIALEEFRFPTYSVYNGRILKAGSTRYPYPDIVFNGKVLVSELVAGFQSLSPEYQRVFLLAQEQHQIRVAPLQTLVGGLSGAMVFLVNVTHQPSQRVEHLILKLDRKSPKARSDELSRHVIAQSRSPIEFARDRLNEAGYWSAWEAGQGQRLADIVAQILN